MSIGGKINPNNLQFFVKKTNKSLVELNLAEGIGKIRVGFVTYDKSKEKGDRSNNKIDFYFSMDDFGLLAHDILSGNVARTLALNVKNANGGYPKPARQYLGGTTTEGKVISRMLQIEKGTKVDNVLKVMSGPGKKSDTGGIVPDFKLNAPDKYIIVGLTNDELKKFALQGQRALDFYYTFCFGREEK